MIELPDGRSLSVEQLELLRRIAVRAVVELKMTQKQAANLVGVSENTVGQWCAAWQDAGADSFEMEPTGRPVGSGRSLTPEEEQDVRDQIAGTSPTDHGISASRWTRRTVGELIQKQCGIKLSDQGVGNYLQRWGLTPQKPARRAKEADADEIQEFVDEKLPETMEKAAKEGGEVHFADETGFKASDQIGRTYAPCGETPVLEFPKTRIAQNMISSVTPDGDIVFAVYSGTMNATRFIDWLEALVGSTDKKVFLFVDSHPAHKAKAVQQWLDERTDQIELTWLPRYSPEHNPDEFVNNDVKQNLKNEPLPEDTPEFRKTIERIMDQIASMPERIKGYFQQSELANEFS